VWAPIGVRPIALGRHRFKWLYAAAFVSPAAGERFGRVASGESKPFFEAPPGMVAQEAGVGRNRAIVLVLDNAGWRSEPNLTIPEGVRLAFPPLYTPELQPAETP
jgi:hypothetical protein